MAGSLGLGTLGWISFVLEDRKRRGVKQEIGELKQRVGYDSWNLHKQKHRLGIGNSRYGNWELYHLRKENIADSKQPLDGREFMVLMFMGLLSAIYIMIKLWR